MADNTLCTMQIVLFNKFTDVDSSIYIPTNLDRCFFHLERKDLDSPENGTLSPKGSALIPDTSLSEKTLVPPKEWSALGLEYILSHRELMTLNFDDLIALGASADGVFKVREIEEKFTFFSVREFTHNKTGSLSSYFIRGV